MRATKELYYDDDKKVLAPAPSSVNRLLLIAEAAEKCALLDPSALLKSGFVLSSLEQPDVDYGNDILIHENNPNNTSRKSLRVCCYGSSSSQTPVAYLQEAATLGFLLAIRGHTCVNGAGSFGCMAAMNDGAAAGNGHIVGVIHEMWLVDGAEKEIAENKDDEQDHLKREWSTVRPLRDGGAHRIFEQQQQDDDNDETASSSAAASATRRKKGGPRREMLVAGGKDLQQRKRLLVDKADALIVLPGGPGTWDEVRVCVSFFALSRYHFQSMRK
jgi:predicted Rossmann-fold nucleotide-binding protein